MKYAESIILWNAVSDWPTWPKAGLVVKRLDAQLETDDADYCNSIGGCFSWAGKTELEMQKQVLEDFNMLILKEALVPRAVHREFLKIAEYRAAISPWVEKDAEIV